MLNYKSKKKKESMFQRPFNIEYRNNTFVKGDPQLKKMELKIETEKCSQFIINPLGALKKPF